MRRDSREYIEATIRNRAFSLVYQPIVHLDTGTLSGVETLCRFDDGRPPHRWFKQCEAFGLAGPMDLAIIGMALEDVDDLPQGYLALNLSAATLMHPTPLRQALRPLLERRPIVIELTEHDVVEDYETVTAAVDELRGAGVLLAVDDAGAGYSTLQHILRLRPDIIKLDRSITHEVDHDPARRALTSALVIFAAEIDASVVAEGIETEAELFALRAAGVARGQGFWLARPGQLPLPPVDYEPMPFVDLAAAALTSDPVRLPSAARPGDRLFGVDPMVSVVAHGVLSSLASIASAVELLRLDEGAMPVEERRALCSVMHRQVVHVSEVLKDLVRGLPPDALRTLDDLVRG